MCGVPFHLSAVITSEVTDRLKGGPIELCGGGWHVWKSKIDTLS